MVKIVITDNIKPLIKKLNKQQRQQVPFATSQALNDTAFKVQTALKVQASQKLDRPTPYTLRGFRYKRSTKRNLNARVFINDIQYEYLRYQIEGGTRRPHKGTALPVNIRLNKYGNIPKRRAGIIRGKPNRFVATINGITGVWQQNKNKTKVKLLARVQPQVEYRKRFPYYKIVHGVVRNTFTNAFNKRLTAALLSAR